MTSRRSPPEKKAAAKQAPSAKDAESESPMKAFKSLAKKVVSVSREDLADAEKRERKKS